VGYRIFRVVQFACIVIAGVRTDTDAMLKTNDVRGRRRRAPALEII
jgi:hypothetical protein